MISRSVRRLAWAQRIAAALVALFWISFVLDFRELPAAMVDFEWSFIAPDLLWIVAPFLVASHWLLTGNRKGRAATAVAGGAIFYLGLLDVAYNVRHGQYATSRGFLDAAVNIACLVFGAVNIRFGLRDE
ncbi:MAG TPA: hypothetical protein VHY84_15450 [Bryobacteraceae bacterium]|jgi:hypothetical protein|nr:hypothetical protein [Bryobacteraceae bacterium]